MRKASQNFRNARFYLIVAAVIMAISFASSCSSNNDSQNLKMAKVLPGDSKVLSVLSSSVNLPGANQVMTDGKHIYFNSIDNKFVRADADGANLLELNQNPASWPLIASEQIFFSAGSASGPLSKMKLDGSSHVRVGSGTVSGLVFYQDMIYAIEEPERVLIKVKSDGTKREQLVNFSVNSYVLRGDSLYIAGKSAQDGIIRYDLETGSQELLLDVAAGNLQSDGDYLYYADLQKQYHLYAIDISGYDDLEPSEASAAASTDSNSDVTSQSEADADKAKNKLTAALIMEYSFDRQFAVFDQTIYFIDSASQQQLYRSKLNKDNKIGRNDAILTADDAVDSFCLIGPFVYYRRAGITRLYRTDLNEPRPIRIN